MKAFFSCIVPFLALCVNIQAQATNTNEAVSLTRQQLRDSLAAASQELSFHPDSLDLRLRKASWNVQLKQWQYARDEYDYVLDRNPQNVAALFYRAFVNEKQKRYGFARLDYERLLALAPNNFEAKLGLALLNNKDCRYTEAMNQINLLVTQYPDSAVAYAARGGMEMERKMLAPAEFDYSKAINLDPTNTDYRLNRAHVRLMMKRKNDAREDLDEMVRLGVSRATLVEWYKKCR